MIKGMKGDERGKMEEKGRFGMVNGDGRDERGKRGKKRGGLVW